MNIPFSHHRCLTVFLLLTISVTAFGGKPVSALSTAETKKDTLRPPISAGAKTIPLKNDSITLAAIDSVRKKKNHLQRNWATWRPDTKRALWLSLVIPGAGQIYNRKYWKLPIVYGGFVGCFYAITWNNQMYHDYAQAYVDIMDDDPETQSYNEFLHLGATVTSENLSRYQTLFKNRKNRYRRWRDMSVFSLIGVYALSVIDAYVDASLSDFDISRDLSLHFGPAIIGDKTLQNGVKNQAIGLECYLSF